MRVKKKIFTGGVHSKTVIFVYSGGKLIEEYSTDPPQNPKTKYLTEDHLGTPRIITDGNGEVISRRDFMPFGEDINSTIGTRSTSSFKYASNEDDVRQKFTGYQKDEETNLDFAEARMYENRHARFTAVDPLLASGNGANPQTFNRFTYVVNNPLFYTDPTGECPIKDGVETCPDNYYGTVYTRTINGVTSFNDEKPDDSWSVFEGETTRVRLDTGKLTHFNQYGWFETVEGGGNTMLEIPNIDGSITIGNPQITFRIGEEYVGNYVQPAGGAGGAPPAPSGGGGGMAFANRALGTSRITNPARLLNAAPSGQPRVSYGSSSSPIRLPRFSYSGRSTFQGPPNFTFSSVNPRNVNFMQSSMRNTTGDFTVLGNAQSLNNGSLNPGVLNFRVWMDSNHRVWALDHRRLGAFRIANFNNAPVRIVPKPTREMFKMTTKTKGKSIKLKFEKGDPIIID